MDKILICDGLEKEAIESLKKDFDVEVREVTPDELKADAGKYSALIVRSRSKVTKDVIDGGKGLKVIGRAGVGVDNIDVAAATARGVMVVNAPTANTISVAELAFGLILSLARNLPRADASMKAGKWDKKAFMGTEIHGKTLGLVGSGRIGTDVAKKAAGFGLRVIAYDPYLKKEAAEKAGILLVDSLDMLLAESDIVSIHAALTKETQGMIGRTQLAKMKKTAFIINCARGGIVEEGALCEALKNRTIAGAGLDVFENEPPAGSPLLALDNAVLCPHIGASTGEAQKKAGGIIAEQVRTALKGGKPDCIVNPDVWKKQ
jgi:D-3-phosphoglycerate dehydrogenase